VTLSEAELKELLSKALTKQLEALRGNEKNIQRAATLRQELERLLKTINYK
jgi:hypothetical protein